MYAPRPNFPKGGGGKNEITGTRGIWGMLLPGNFGLPEIASGVLNLILPLLSVQYYYRKGTFFSVHEKSIWISRNGPLEKFTRFLFMRWENFRRCHSNRKIHDKFSPSKVPAIHLSRDSEGSLYMYKHTWAGEHYKPAFPIFLWQVANKAYMYMYVSTCILLHAELSD